MKVSFKSASLMRNRRPVGPYRGTSAMVTSARGSVGRRFLVLRKPRANSVGLHFLKIRKRTKAGSASKSPFCRFANHDLTNWSLVLWCFVLNPHRRSPYPKSHLELRDKLRVSSPVRAIGTNRVLLLLANGSSVFRSGPIPRRSSHGPVSALGRGVGRREAVVAVRTHRGRHLHTQAYLTESVHQVVLHKSIPTQIRQHILCVSNDEG